MLDYLIKAFSFFVKEFHDVRRQPRLMLSLVGGPLLVLAAFGATFRSANPFVSVALVWPENGVPGISLEQAEQMIGSNFYLVKVTSDQNEAMDMLNRGQVDVVQIVPAAPAGSAGETARPEIQVISKTVDPNAEAWIRSLSYGELNIINQRLLTQQADLAQVKAREVGGYLQDAQGEFEQLQQEFTPAEVARADQTIQQVRPLLDDLLALLPANLVQAGLAPELSDLYGDIETLAADLDQLDQFIQQGDLANQAERLASTLDEIQNLRGRIDQFVGIPAEQIVSPVTQTYTNLRGSAYSLVVFYAPAVLALLVQQLAITLASLGLVRERQMGSFEMFRVSPLRFSQILLGKSLAYILYVTVAGLILTGLLTLLKVPFPAYPGQFLLVLILLSTAAVGIGFLISAASRTDSQAIQLTMLVLLLSIFFTGFFLPITGFAWPAWILALMIPMTHGVDAFQELMLAGNSLTPATWLFLGGIILLSFGAVVLMMRRQYRRALD